jgi:hypothetical protein
MEMPFKGESMLKKKIQFDEKTRKNFISAFSISLNIAVLKKNIYFSFKLRRINNFVVFSLQKHKNPQVDDF